MSSPDALNVEFPPKLAAALFIPKRYLFVRGGRGSGKSWSIARALILKAFASTERVLCTREVQKSIKQSVHQLLRDQIAALGLGGFFQILENEIRGLNGSAFYFSGLSDQTADSIKSFEGCSVVWCEEAHTITRRSWRILTPTIRAANSEIWATYNPELESDETHQMAVINPAPDTVSIELNYMDNPWFPEVLEAERTHAQKTMKADDYEHIWGGRCKPAVDGAIYFDEIANAEREGRIRDVPIDPLLKTHAIWDLGWNDSMSIILIQRSASELRIVDYIEDSHRTLADYVMQLKAMPLNWGVHYLPHDGFAKDYKTGKSAQEIMEALGCSIEQTPNMAIEEGIRAARMTFSRVYFDKTKAARLIECLKRYRRHINKQTNEAGAALHDEFSHGCLDGETLISTSRGLIPIKLVVIGDMVETPAGFAQVTNSGVTKIATEIIEITMNNGAVLLATPEHPIFTIRGVVSADALRYNDAIFTMESAPCLSFQSIESAGYRNALIESFKVRGIGSGLVAAFTRVRSAASNAFCTLRSTAQYTVSLISRQRLSASMGICATSAQTTGSSSGQSEHASTLFKRLMGYAFTSSQRAITKPTTKSMAASPCTDMYGNGTTGLSAQDFMSIMSMATNPTTASPTWNYSQPVTTAHTMAAQIRGSEVRQTSGNLLKLENWRKHGIQALKVWSGIARTALQFGRIAKCTLKTAQNVASLTKLRTQQGQSSAIRIAKLRLLEGAEATRPVYDLTVDHHHCYIANGVLVSNCDAFRYAAIVADALSNSNGSVKPIAYRKGRYLA